MCVVIETFPDGETERGIKTKPRPNLGLSGLRDIKFKANKS